MSEDKEVDPKRDVVECIIDLFNFHATLGIAENEDGDDVDVIELDQRFRPELRQLIEAERLGKDQP